MMTIIQRPRARRLAAGLVALTVTAAMIVGCAANTPAQNGTARAAATVTITVNQPVNTVDPQATAGNLPGGILKSVFEGLTVLDGTSIKPALATSWDVSKDKLRWTFRLRESVTFSDGAPFNADAVVKNYQRLFDPDTLVPLRTGAGPVISATAVDEYTVMFETSKPYSSLPTAMAVWMWAMISPKSIDQWGTDLGTHAPAGTGPYTIEDFTPSQSLTLKKNDGYWGDEPPTGTVKFITQADDSSRMASLLSGGADVDVYATPEQKSRIASSNGFKVDELAGGRIYMVDLPMGLPALQDVRVRQAMSLAIDRDAIVKSIFQGYANPAKSPTPAGIGYADIGEIKYDPDKAAALLKEAGWVKGPDGVIEKDGAKFPTLQLQASRGMVASDEATAQAVLSYLQAAGFPVKLTLTEGSAFQSTMTINAKDKQWMVQVSFSSPLYDTGQFLNVIYRTGEGLNYGGYSNAEVDKLLTSMDAEFDDAKLQGIKQQIAKLVWDDVPSLFLVVPKFLAGVREGVSGIEWSPSTMNDYSNVARK